MQSSKIKATTERTKANLACAKVFKELNVLGTVQMGNNRENGVEHACFV